MRLIDADKVIQSIDMQMIIARELLSNDTQFQEFVSIAEQSIKQEINNAPTVNAIPKEWIKNYIADRSSLSINWSYVEDMLEDWEKENADNN